MFNRKQANKELKVLYFIKEFLSAFNCEKTLIVSVDEVGFGSRKQYKRTYGNYVNLLVILKLMLKSESLQSLKLEKHWNTILLLRLPYLQILLNLSSLLMPEAQHMGRLKFISRS